MTTVAFRHGVLAADGYSMSGNTIGEREAQKVFRLFDGRLCAGAGPRALIIRYRDWLNGLMAERPSLHLSADEKGSAAVMVVRLDGVAELHETDGIVEINDEFCATGTGEEAALAAMHMGADAVKAIEIAALVDPYTGGKIHAETVQHLDVDAGTGTADDNLPGTASDWRAFYNLRKASA